MKYKHSLEDSKLAIFSAFFQKIACYYKDKIVPKLQPLINALKSVHLNKTQKIIAAVALSLIIIAVSVFGSGVKVSFDVFLNGEKIAHISSTQVYKEAKELSREIIVSDNKDEVDFVELKLKPVLSLNTEKTTAEVLSTTILNSTESVVSAYAVVQNDTTKLYVSDKNAFEALVDKRLHYFDVEGYECTCELSDKLTFESVYLDKNMLSTDEKINEFANALDVVTTAVKVSTYETPFKTVYKETSSKYVGYSAVTTNGVNGVNKVTKTIKYLNGEMIEEPTVTDVCVTEVVNKVITTGTGSKPSATFTAPKALGDYLWPVNVAWRITSYWGDSRGHKGLDIGRSLSLDSIHGADILASKSGTITKSRYNGGYGYMVEIDHGDGTKTRYAHCSKLLYKEGSYVTKGTVIAKVGSSGNSSGPHLHFEILVNGTQVNPEKYFVLR